jgi:hypothetical protein
LQAFKSVNGSTLVSAPVPLVFIFSPIDFVGFSANPSSFTMAGGTLTWEVTGAKSLTLQGNLVKLKDSQKEIPSQATTYTLAATWVDGTVLTKSLPVGIQQVQVTNITSTGPTQSRSQFQYVYSYTITFTVTGPATAGEFTSLAGANSLYKTSGNEISNVGGNQWQGIVRFTSFTETNYTTMTIGYSFSGGLLFPTSGIFQVSPQGVFEIVNP